jgi:hypothetical protein
MPLYTFFLDYRGGTYLSQVSAPSPIKALRVWAERFDPTPVPGLGPKSKEELIRAARLDRPVAIDGVKKTWCSVALLRGQLALIHFVQTAE